MLQQIQVGSVFREDTEEEPQEDDARDLGADRRLYTPSPEQDNYDYDHLKTARHYRANFRLYHRILAF